MKQWWDVGGGAAAASTTTPSCLSASFVPWLFPLPNAAATLPHATLPTELLGPGVGAAAVETAYAWAAQD